MSTMKFHQKEFFYPESRFGGITDIDGTVTFFSRVNSLISSDSVVLDVGCGRGALKNDKNHFRKYIRIFKGRVNRVIGIDVDTKARENPFLDEFYLIQGDCWPIESDSIDLIISDNVLEHIENPNFFFSESRRVLKKCGYLCIRTPNRWSYIALGASIVPDSYHAKVISHLRHSVARKEDRYPTFYRCNSIRKIRNLMKKNDFQSVVYAYEAEPSYLSFSDISYFFGVMHQKFAPKCLKPAIFAFGQLRKDS